MHRGSSRRRAWSRALGGVALLAASALTSWSCSSGESPSPPTSDSPSSAPRPPGVAPVSYAPGSVIVRFKDAAGLADVRASTLQRIKGSIEDRNRDGVHDHFANLDPSGRLMKVDLEKSVTVEQALELLRADPSVAYAEPNYLLHVAQRASAIPGDARFSDLWGMHNTGQTGGVADADIDAPEAWELSTGSSDIVVGVIDTGVDYTHPDLVANMWRNPGELPGNNIDDDNNGVIDDVHGYNAINGSGDPMDDHSHGTHCSGTIGGAGDNAIGVAGVNWEVSIMAIKFLSASGGGTTADAIEGIDYAVGRKNAGVNLRVLSNSWGGGGFSQGLKDAIDAAGDADILFAAAAGNDFGSNNDVFPFYPASYTSPNIVAVASTNHFDGRSFFSNIGPTSVDLGAPGEDILSTVPGNGYSFFSGTSMATPHVAGAAALVLSLNDSLSTEELKQLLLDSGDPNPALDGLTLSGRRLNAANALAQAGPPTPRFNLGVSPTALVMNQADTGTYQIEVAEVAGFTGDVALTVTSQPALDAAITVTPSSVTVPGTAVLEVASSMTTAPGSYLLTLTGQSGALTRTRQLSLQVRPFGTIENRYPSTDTPLPLPDLTTNVSTIHVTDAFELQQVHVDLDMSHTFFPDLRITLTSPAGTVAVLHDHSSANPSRRHSLPLQFAGESPTGDWRLTIADTIGGDAGTLHGWALELNNIESTASFDLAMAPDDLMMAQGGSTFPSISVSARDGFSGLVDLSLTSEPELIASHFFSPSAVNAPGFSNLFLSTGCSTAPGVYELAVIGQSGGMARSTPARLTVLPEGATLLEREAFDTPRQIPDNNPNGTTSTLSVSDRFPMSSLDVRVDLTHPAIGQLTVQLLAPSGETITLHDRSGGDEDNLRRWYSVPALAGAQVQGTWRLKVIDHVGQQTGRLDSWRLRATDTRLAPVANFFVSGNFLSFSFDDFSHDVFSFCSSSGFIESWHWDFGDGTTSNEIEPAHVYAAAGTYQVTLTVTDNDGFTGSLTRSVTATRPPPQLAIERITRNRGTFEFAVDLTWSGAEGALVELHRNFALADIPNNDGVHRDVFRRFETSYNWRICELHTSFCSNQVSVVFGSGAAGVTSNGEPTSATIITTLPDGSSSSRVVPIVD